MEIVVMGGTGLIGSIVVDKLRSLGHHVRSASPTTGVNALTREGLKDAFSNAHTAIDVTESSSFGDGTAMHFFQASGQNLVSAELVANIKHHIVLSVVGAEHLQTGNYFKAKLAQENIVKRSSIPFTIIRATQFFEFIGNIALSAAETDSVRLPRSIIQPIAAEDVALAIVKIALNPPANNVVEIAGPEVFYLGDLVRRLLAHNNDNRSVVIDPDARYFGAPLCDNSLLPRSAIWLGETKFDWWLTHVAARPIH